MLRPLSLLPALVVVVTALAPPPATAEPDDDRLPPISRHVARSSPMPAEESTPLEVRIDALSPSYIPVRGSIRMSGSVTNVSDDVWVDVNVYAFAGATPITSTDQLAQERELDPTQPVGERITDAGTFDDVDQLDPGESAQFSLEVPRSRLTVSEPGVYWFGAHALGQGPDGRDLNADGRARTFMPLVPPGRRTLDTALVIPVRHDIRHNEDGSIADVEAWAADLDAGGPLRTLVDFGASAGSRPVTWLVDPAVPETVQSLVAGNPPRFLGDTVDLPDARADDEEGAEGTPEPTTDPVPSESATPGPDLEEVPSNAATEPGTAWLDRLREATSGNQVLALPYGDVDVSAAVEWDERVYEAARRRSGTELAPWALTASPAVAAPSGFLDPTALHAIHRRATILVSDEMFGPDAPAVASADGRRLVVTSSAADGGPGPGDPLSGIALRQQVVSESALRLLSPGRKPLVVLLPLDWAPTSTTDFFEGLDVPWVNLTDVDGLDGRQGGRVRSDQLAYPDRQARRELDAANFTSAADLVGAGQTLQNVLTDNDAVGGDVEDEALSGLSYASRNHPDASRAAADRSRAYLQQQLGAVTVSAPPAVTLSSSRGTFSATLTNALDHAVTVRVEAVAEEPLRINGPDTIEIAAESSTSVLLNASAAQLGVSNVELVVTDQDGTPLGSSDELPIRSVQVSQLIWVIIGTGVALLFGTIIVRLIRRVRRARVTA